MSVSGVASPRNPHFLQSDGIVHLGRSHFFAVNTTNAFLPENRRKACAPTKADPSPRARGVFVGTPSAVRLTEKGELDRIIYFASRVIEQKAPFFTVLL